MKRFFKLRNVIIFTIVFLVVAQTFKIDKTSPFISSSLDFIALEKPPFQFEKMIGNF